MKNTLALKVSGLVFLFVAIMHLLRVVLKVELVVAGVPVPLWASLGGFIVSFTLSLWMFKSVK